MDRAPKQRTANSPRLAHTTLSLLLLSSIVLSPLLSVLLVSSRAVPSPELDVTGNLGAAVSPFPQWYDALTSPSHEPGETSSGAKEETTLQSGRSEALEKRDFAQRPIADDGDGWPATAPGQSRSSGFSSEDVVLWGDGGAVDVGASRAGADDHADQDAAHPLPSPDEARRQPVKRHGAEEGGGYGGSGTSGAPDDGTSAATPGDTAAQSAFPTSGPMSLDPYEDPPDSFFYTLDVHKAGPGSGYVSDMMLMIDCGDSCSGIYAEGDIVELTAEPDPGHTFAGWEGDCLGSDPTCEIKMDMDKEVTATFLLFYTMTVTALGPGSGVITSTPSGITCATGDGPCEKSFLADTPVTLTAVPSPTFTLAGWGGDCSGIGDCELRMDEDKHVSAQFKRRTALTMTGHTPDPSFVGRPVVVSYTVVSESGDPTGAVTVTVSGEPTSCTGPAPTGSCTLTPTLPGGKTITATYGGDADFASSWDTATHTVETVATTTTVTAHTPDPSFVGRPVVLSYTVASDGDDPTGAVTVTVSGEPISCTGPAPTGSCVLTPTLVGSKTVTATYGGATAFKSSRDTVSHTVDELVTRLEISADTPDPSVTGQAVEVTYALSADPPGVVSPTGRVTVTVSGEPGACGGPVPTGSCVVTPTLAGSKTITAAYDGDVNHQGSQITETHTVTKADTAVDITAFTPDESLPEEPIAVSYTVAAIAPGSGTPSGDVMVEDSDGNSCTGPAPSGGCVITPALAGGKVFTVTYAGDSNYHSSVGTDSYTVNRASSRITITNHTPRGAPIGVPLTVSYTVASLEPGLGPPPGVVTVTLYHEIAQCTGPAPTGSCVLTPTIAQGTLVQAHYSGAVNFEPSEDSAAHLVRGPGLGTDVTITAHTPHPSVTGQPVVVSYTVAPTASTSLSPSGAVIVQDDEGNRCTADVAAAGCILTPASAGARTLSAIYAGDPYFTGNYASVAHDVDRADTTTSISAHLPEPSTVGHPVEITYRVEVKSPGSGTPSGDVTVSDGDGNTCTARATAGSCTLTPTEPGIKTLTAIYAGDANLNASQGTTTHEVNDVPVAGLTAQADAVLVGESSTFTASQQAGSNLVYRWDFGDGSLSVTTTHRVISYTYDVRGTYPVRLLASNRASTATAEATATVEDVPIAGLTVSTDAEQNGGVVLLWDTLVLTAEMSAGTGVAYRWWFDDATPGQRKQTVKHVYADIGVYTPTVSASNEAGTATAAASPVRVVWWIRGLTANSSPAHLGQRTVFTSAVASGVGEVYYTWDFGDGSSVLTTTDQTVAHVYPKVGHFTATITADNVVTSQTINVPVYIADEPINGLSAVSSEPTAVDMPTAFTATVLSGSRVVYTWDFGDGTPPITGTHVQHSYDPPLSITDTVTYNVVVTATNETNQMTTTTAVDVYLTPSETRQVGDVRLTAVRFRDLGHGVTRASGMVAFADGKVRLRGAEAVVTYTDTTLDLTGRLELRSNSRTLPLGYGSFSGSAADGLVALQGSFSDGCSQLSGFDVSGVSVTQVDLIEARVRGTADRMELTAPGVATETNVERFSATALDSEIRVSGELGAVEFTIVGSRVSASGMTLDSFGASASQVSLTLPEVLKDRAFSASNLRLDPNGITLDPVQLQHVSGDTMEIVSATADLMPAPGGGRMFKLDGDVNLRLPQNRQAYAFSGVLDDAGDLHAATSQVKLDVAGLEITLPSVAFQSLDDGISGDRGVLQLPSRLGGSSGALESVVLDVDGLRVDGSSTFPMPDFSLADGTFDVSDTDAYASLTGSGIALQVDGKMDLSSVGVPALIDLALDIDPSGRIGGELDDFGLPLAFLNLNVAGAGIRPDGAVYAKEASIEVPAEVGLSQAGAVKAAVYNVSIDADGLSIGGGEFALPDMDFGTFSLVSLGGKLIPTANGYDIGAQGGFQILNVPGQRGPRKSGCNGVWVAVTLSVDEDGRAAMTLMPVEEAPLSVQAISSPRLKEAQLKLFCRIPIDATGFYVTRIRGTVNLSRRESHISLGMTIASMPAVGGVWPLWAEADATVYASDPGRLALLGTLKVFVMSVGGAEAELSSGGFSARVYLDMVVAWGNFSINAWSDRRGFSFTASGRVSVGLREGALGSYCVPFIKCKWVKKWWCGYPKCWWSDLCTDVPPWNMRLGSVSMEGGRFTNDDWGFKAWVRVLGSRYGVYVDHELDVDFGSVSRYHLMTPYTLAAARRGIARQGVDSVDGTTTMATGDIVQDVVFGPAESATFSLKRIGDAPTLTLRTPQGVAITPSDLPANVDHYEVVDYEAASTSPLSEGQVTGIACPACESGANSVEVTAGDAAGSDYLLAFGGDDWASTVPISRQDLERLAIEAEDLPVSASPLKATSATGDVPQYADFRVAHAAPGWPKVNVVIDGSHVFTTATGPLTYFEGLAFRDVSDYRVLKTGTVGMVQVSVVRANQPTIVLLTESVSLPANGEYTLTLIEESGTLELVRLLDRNEPLPEGEAQARLVNLLPVTQTLDLHHEDGLQLVADVDYQSASDYVPLDGGVSNLTVHGSEDFKLLTTVSNATTREGHVHTVFVMPPAAGASTPRAFLHRDTTGRARIRFINAGPDQEALDLRGTQRVDGAVRTFPLFEDIGYGDATHYLTFDSGETITVQVTPASISDTVLMTRVITLEEGQDYTVIAADDDGGAHTLLLLEDDNTVLAPGTTRLRLVNAGSARALTLKTIDDFTLFTDVAYNTASAYTEINGGTYWLDLWDRDGWLRFLRDTLLRDGQVYTLIALAQADGGVELRVLTDLATDKTVQTMYVVQQPEPGTWQVTLGGNPQPEDQYVLSVIGTSPAPALDDVTVTHTPGEEEAQVSWRLTTSEPDTRLGIHANSGPLTRTEVVTDPNSGVAFTAVITNYVGPGLVDGLTLTETGWITDTALQTYTVDVSSLSSGAYWLWMDVDDGLSPPVRVYAAGVVSIPVRPWSLAWHPVITATAGMRSVDVAWTPHPDPDVDRYALEVSGPTISGTDVMTIGHLYNATLTNLNPNEVYTVSVRARNGRTGQIARSPAVTATPQGAPLTLAATGGGTLTLERGQSAMVSLRLTTTMSRYPEPVGLTAGSLPAGLALDVPTGLFTPTLAGTPVSVVVTATEHMAHGTHVAPILANGVGESSELSLTLQVGGPELTVKVAGKGEGIVASDPMGIHCQTDCAEIYSTGTPVTLTAMTDPESVFTAWSGDVESTANPLAFVMDADKTITATFVLNTYVITPTAGAGGTISPATPQTVNCGDDVAFTMVPEANCRVSDVLVDGASVGAVEVYTFTDVAADHTISAAFATDTYVITPTAGAGGTITPATPQTVSHGGSRAFTTVPNSGFSIADVDVDGISIGAVEVYSFTNVNADHTISATFAQDGYTKTVPTAGSTLLVYTDTQGLITAVEIPEGAVTETVTLVCAPHPTPTHPISPSLRFAGHAFDLDIYLNGVIQPGYRFNAPITITIQYSDEDLVGLDEEALMLYHWDGAAWRDAACGAGYERHPDENWLSVEICHLTGFALLGQGQPVVVGGTTQPLTMPSRFEVVCALLMALVAGGTIAALVQRRLI